jgi:hypothetical protein
MTLCGPVAKSSRSYSITGPTRHQYILESGKSYFRRGMEGYDIQCMPNYLDLDGA